jgi:hypothetical protein
MNNVFFFNVMVANGINWKIQLGKSQTFGKQNIIML